MGMRERSLLVRRNFMNSFATLWESVLKKLESYYQANRNAIAYEMYIKSLSPAFEENIFSKYRTTWPANRWRSALPR